MEKLNYPGEPKDEYLIYKLESEAVEEFVNAEWDIRNLERYKGGNNSALPFAVSLADLMRVKV